VSINEIISGAAKLATDDPSAPFAELPTGVIPVTVNSPPVINFVIKAIDGRVVTGLSTDEISMAFAKLVPGTTANQSVPGSGESAEWVSYIYEQKDGVWQATTDTPNSLVYNSAGGYYTYTFTTDVTTATLPDTDTLIWDPTATQRVAIQLQIMDANANTVAVFNPYLDVTIGADGGSLPVTADETHVVVDKGSCNECHNQLAMHGGGRVDPQYCVMCHNLGTTDAVSGNVLDFKVMIHKIHAGRYLELGYEIGDLHDYSEVGFPQDLRNCAKCHDGADVDDEGNLLTPQGDNWKTKPTQQACGACHDDEDFNDHEGNDFIAEDGTLDNSECERCHTSGGSGGSGGGSGGSGGSSEKITVEDAHWNQLEENAGNYQFNIEDVAYDADTRQVTVSYSVTNPNDGTTYDLTEDCTGDCISDDKFFNLRLYVASLSLIGASNSIADYTNTLSDRAINGMDDGSHHYTLTLPALPDTAVEQSHGTARVVSIGQVKEANLASGAEDPNTLLDVPVLNTYQEFVLDGTLQSRRVVVSDAKCNACHGLLGTASGSNTLVNAFHSGARNTVESCPICHNANRASNTLMTDSDPDSEDVLPFFPDTSPFAGRTFNQTYEFKTMIHGIHGGEKRASPYTQGNPLGDDDSNVVDYSDLVDYPGILSDCTTCHVGDSYRTDQGVLGSSVLSTDTTVFDPATGLGNPNADLLDLVTNLDGLIDPLQLPVFSPQAASCAGCHDTAANREHMSSVGGGAFDLNQAAVGLDGKVFERCDECHGTSGTVDIKSVHHIE